MMSDPRYLAAHRKIREDLLRAAYGTPCPYARVDPKCLGFMWPGQPLDLAHAPDGSYLGLAHAACNRREGAIRGNKLRGLRRRSVIFPTWWRKGS
jgi:hypothetical protein